MREEDASFTNRRACSYHGYKGHIAADRSGIVSDYRYSDAPPHDSNFIDELTQKERKMVVGDSDYRSAEREAEMQPRGVVCALAFKRQRGQPRLPLLL